MLILASASPRRHDLLNAAGIPHVVRPSSMPEDRRPGEDAVSFVRRIAEEKARAVARGAQDIVLGADTVVCCEGDIFGKPKDEADAAYMLRILAGRAHQVHTGVCVLSAKWDVVEVATTKVFFITLSDKEIREYIRTGEAFDKAGAYAIQGYASKFVSHIQGCYHNVVGLPVSLVYRILREMGAEDSA